MAKVNHEVMTLDSEAKVCFVDVAYADSLRVNIDFDRAGRYYSVPGKPETAHITEHMIFQGSETLPDLESFRDAVESNGAAVNASTFADRMQYSFISPTYGAMSALHAYLGAIERPRFSPASLQTEREVVREELTGYLNRDNFQLWPAIQRGLSLPAVSIVEELSTLDSVTPDDLHEHHRRTHGFDTMSVTITGALDDTRKQGLLEMLNDMDLPRTTQQPELERTIPQPEAPILLERADKSNVYYVIGSFGMKTPPLRDVMAHELTSTLLYEYQHSKIYGQARELGLAYGTQGGWRSGSFGMYEFMTFGNIGASNAAKLWRLTRKALSDTIENVDQTQLDKARVHCIGTRLLAFEDLDAIHDRANDTMRKYGTVGSLEESQRILESITVEDLYEAARKGLTSGVGVAAALANSQNLKNPEIIAELENVQAFLSAHN